MEYLYAALLLHKEGQEISEDNVKKVIEAAGGKADDNKVKALVVALRDIDIDKTIKEAAIPSVSAPAKEEKKEVKEEKKEEKISEEKAAAGLSSLFG